MTREDDACCGSRMFWFDKFQDNLATPFSQNPKFFNLYASDIDVSKIKENLAFDEILYNLSKSIELRTIEDIEFINDLKKEESNECSSNE